MATPRRHDSRFALNRSWWDTVVPIHEASSGYDRDAFLRGEISLGEVERRELGPHVSGRSLLHLQCHFGIDTLNWARLGARVTGLDFSPAAVEAALRLSQESGVPGRFVCANVYDARFSLGSESFDIVTTGIGALNWLPDIRGWAEVASQCARSGGLLYVYDAHPMLNALENDRADAELVVSNRYFEHPEPAINLSDRSYVDGPSFEARRNCEWNHGLGEIATALIAAGFGLEFIHEHREAPWRALPAMEMIGDGAPELESAHIAGRMWQLPAAQRDLVPLMFSLLARRNG
jgi:SAM-dependent methyltransferase